MLRCSQRGFALLRSTAVAGSRARYPSIASPAAADARAGLIARPQGQQSKGAFDTAVAGQARWMSAAAPGSAEDKSDGPKSKPDGFLSRVMGKDSCVVGYDGCCGVCLFSLPLCMQRMCTLRSEQPLGV